MRLAMRYFIECEGWIKNGETATREQVKGLSFGRYLKEEEPENGFDSPDEAWKFIEKNWLGPDENGIEPALTVVETVEAEGV
jgi:hypothetical protein